MKFKSVLKRGLTFTCDLSYIASILLSRLNRLYARKNVRITRQWKSTLTKEKKRRKRKSEEDERRRRENSLYLCTIKGTHSKCFEESH